MNDSHEAERFRAAGTAAVALAAVALAAFTLWIGLSVGGTGVTRLVDDLATVAAAAVATSCCLVAALRSHPQVRTFWRLLGAACAAWTFGEATWAAYDFTGGVVPVPSLADLGYLSAVPLAVAALLSHPAHQSGFRNRTRSTLDGSLLATALLFLSWTFALGPVWRQSDLTTLGGLVAIAYPFGDVVVLFLLFRVLQRIEGVQRQGMRWVLAGLFAMAMSDSAYTYLTADRGYVSGSLIDVGWIAAYLAIAVGASAARSAEETKQCSRRASNPIAAVVGPYLPLLLALGVVAVRVRAGSSIDQTSLLLAFALTGLVLIRQAVAVLGERS